MIHRVSCWVASRLRVSKMNMNCLKKKSKKKRGSFGRVRASPHQRDVRALDQRGLACLCGCLVRREVRAQGAQITCLKLARAPRPPEHLFVYSQSMDTHHNIQHRTSKASSRGGGGRHRPQQDNKE